MNTTSMNAIKFTIGFIVFTAFFFFIPIIEISIMCVTSPCDVSRITIREYLDQKMYPIDGMMDDMINPEPVVCIALYAPVCGMDDKTYSNQCFALGANVTIKHAGVCTP